MRHKSEPIHISKIIPIVLENIAKNAKKRERKLNESERERVRFTSIPV